MTPTDIITGLGQLTAGLKTLGSIVEFSKNTKTRQVVIDLQGVILDLQGKISQFHSAYEDLMRKNRELEGKIQEKADWETIASQYHLHALADGIYVYTSKAGQVGEPAHFLCPNCFEQKKKSILQRPTVDSSKYICHACNFEAKPERPAVPFLGSRSTLDGNMY